MTGLSEAVVIAALWLGALACFRVGSWHRRESRFWRHIHAFDLLGIAPVDALALLAWARANPPSRWEQLRGWRPPHERRGTRPPCSRPGCALEHHR